MSGAAKCKHCEKTEAEHTDNPADYSNCGDFDPSPAPPAERVIEVAPQGVIQHWATSSIGGRGRGRYNCACGFGRASGISYEAFQRHYIIELESALTTMREERDRLQSDLAAIETDLGVMVEERDRLEHLVRQYRVTVKRHPGGFPEGRLAEIDAALKPVSDRQPEGDTTRCDYTHKFHGRCTKPAGHTDPHLLNAPLSETFPEPEGETK